MPAPPPPPAFRAPPSSQPAMPPRASSAFPSLQRPRVRPLPPSFTQSSQSFQRQSTFRPPFSSQSQRPNSNMNLDNRYSPPSSQPPQLFSQPPQSQSQTQRQRQVSRQPASQGDYPLENVDHHRPGSVGPRTAAEVYQGDRPSGPGAVPPKAQKGAEILEKITGLQTYLEEKFTKMEEEDEEFQGALDDRLKGLEDENKDLKERIHELSMGQKVLPTKEELNEEITNQLSPALHEFFGQLGETLKKGLEPLPEQTAGLAAGKVRGHMLEMQDLARKEALKEGAVENPLMTLLNHLITKLGPLDEITSTLASLSGLPDALEQVAVFKNTMEAMQNRIMNRSPQVQAQDQSSTNTNTNQITQILEAVDEIRKKVDTPPAPSVGLDSGKVFGAMTGLKRTLEDLKTSITAGQGVQRAPENVDRDQDMKEMKDLVLELKAEMAALKEKIHNVTPAPLAAPPPQPAIDEETISTLRAILDHLKSRDLSANQLPTPSTGLRPATAAASELEELSPSPRILPRQIIPTAKARQDPAAMRVLDRRNTQPTSGEPEPGPGPQPTDIFGVVQPIPLPSNTTTVTEAHKKRKTRATTGPKPTLGSTLPITNNAPEEDISQGTSSRNTSTGSVVNRGRKRKTPPDDSLGIKQENLKAKVTDKPMTRADSTRATKALGIDVIDLASSSEGSGSGKGKGTRKGSDSSAGKGKKKATATPSPPQSTRSWALPPASGSGLPIAVNVNKSLPLPESQIDIPESQLPENRIRPEPEPTQIDSMTDYGHGQLPFPSVPSLPRYESTGYTATFVGTRHEHEDHDEEEKENVTSTEQVEESLMVPEEKAKRAEPSYRRFQKQGQAHGQEPKTYGGNSRLHGFMGGKMSLLDDSDEE